MPVRRYAMSPPVDARVQEAQREFESSLHFNPGEARSQCELAEVSEFD